MDTKHSFIWVFVGENSRFPSGLFVSFEVGKEWVALHKLSGVLTKYPLNEGAYDWAIANGLFLPKKPEHYSPMFIGKFTCAGMDHFHFEDGVLE